MNLSEARAECDRWFAYHKSEDDKVKALQQLAADRRSGRCDAVEGERRRQAIQGNGLTVYDGANLAEAVKTLLKYIDKKERD